jgi:hypothetical protein
VTLDLALDPEGKTDGKRDEYANAEVDVPGQRRVSSA